jgi:polysaccharide export outer membrane protein
MITDYFHSGATRRSAGLSVATVLIFCSLLPAQAPPAGNVETKPLPVVPLGPNDLISINVYGVPQLSRTVRIGNDGSVKIPMIDRAIPATGKLPAALESDIASAFRSNELVVDPLITVTVTEYVSRQITVAGAVRTPSVIQAYTSMKLLEAITRAGGFAEDAGPEVLIEGKAAGSFQPIRRIEVRSLMSHPDDRSNPEVFPGDEIRVPRAPHIYVMGNVRKPGTIALVESSQSSVMKAVALAEGLTSFATNEAWIIRQKQDSAEQEEISVPLAKIMDRKSADVTLLAGDIFYVPDNKTKRISAGVLDRLVSFGSATTSGVLIWRK